MADLHVSPTLSGIVLGLIWFLGFLVGHVVLSRLRNVRNRFRALVKILFASMAGDVLSVAALGVNQSLAGLILAALDSIVLIASLWILYMPFYFVVATSLSIRTLIEVSHSPGHAAPLKALEEKCASAAVLRERLETMAAYGNVVRDGNAFKLTARGTWIARVFSAIKNLWRLGPGGRCY